VQRNVLQTACTFSYLLYFHRFLFPFLHLLTVTYSKGIKVKIRRRKKERKKEKEKEKSRFPFVQMLYLEAEMFWPVISGVCSAEM
jgi:hypothetical protein